MITADFQGVWWVRDGVDTTGILKSNIAHRVKHHSPTGMNVGYAGSGPADFALNILQHRLEMLGYTGEKSNGTWNKQAIYRDIFGLHQKFKFEFLVNADPLMGRISWADIDWWLLTCGNENIQTFMEQEG